MTLPPSNGQEAALHAALTLCPERADLWTRLAGLTLHDGRTETAIQCQREALRLTPDDPEAHNVLGIACHALNSLAEAENHFRGALRLAPDHPHATLNLGVIRQSLGHPEEAEALYRAAWAQGCEPARAANNLALALAEQGRPDEALAACRQALAARPDYPEAEVNLGMLLLMTGQLGLGWGPYEARWHVPPLSTSPRLPPSTRWTSLDQAAGKTILLLAEQGFGDTLQFCRYAPMVQALGARVILAVPAPLVRLMETLAGVDQVVTEDAPVPEHDLHCPLMSLPLLFRTEIDTIPAHIPYLRVERPAIEAWDRLLPPRTGPRIGLVWAGAHRGGQPAAAAVDRRRSMRLADMAPLAEVPGPTFISLQLGPALKHIETAPFPIVDVASGLTDFAATAALIEALDLVIAADTAVAHLAGALGKPVWLLSRFDACWRWMPNGIRPGPDTTPWYPSMRLFRQTRPGDWPGVMTGVVAALHATMSRFVCNHS
jgi:Flp pilus assembly protein TadD